MNSKGNGELHSLEYTHPRSVPPIPSVWVLYKAIPKSGAKQPLKPPLRVIWEHLVQP